MQSAWKPWAPFASRIKLFTVTNGDPPSGALDAVREGPLKENGSVQPLCIKFTNFLSSKNVVLSGNKFFSIFVDLDLSGIQKSLNEYPTY